MEADRNHPKPTPSGPTHSKPPQEKSDPAEKLDEPLPNSAADDFFVNLNRDFRRPKPSEEAVAAALHAIQTLAGDTAEHDAESIPISDSSSDDFASAAAVEPCPKCRAVNVASNRFCGFCGASLLRREKPAAQAPPATNALLPEPPPREQHVHYHHHHYFPQSMPIAKHSFGDANPALTGELAAPPPPPDPAAAETAIQQLVIDWTMCCNAKRLDDLLALYSTDAIVLRANAAPAHGRTAIRQLLQTALQAGLGDVELEPADAGVLGDIACLTGKSRMLVPTAPGQRREETGKFLIVARRESGSWKILADSWCIDSAQKPAAPRNPRIE